MNIEKIKQLIASTLEEKKLSLYELKYELEGNEHYLRVFVDKDEGKLTLDEIVTISEKISLVLDQHDADADSYILDVSSAGAEKLIDPAKLPKYLGTYLKVKLKTALKHETEYVGTLLSVDDLSLTLEVNLKGRMSKVTINRDNISRVNQAIKF